MSQVPDGLVELALCDSTFSQQVAEVGRSIEFPKFERSENPRQVLVPVTRPGSFQMA
jgi:hypothetical protein